MALRIFSVFGLLLAVSSVSPSQSPTPSKRPGTFPSQTTICSTRTAIDSGNLAIISDAQFIAIGAEKGVQPWGNILGTLKATAVLIRAPPSTVDAVFRPTRVDVLLFRRPYQQRNHVTDLFISLYSDDGSVSHNPGQKVGSCANRAVGLSPSVDLSSLSSRVLAAWQADLVRPCKLTARD
jgi:hypothetical protein